MKKKAPKPLTIDFYITTAGFQRNYEMAMRETPCDHDLMKPITGTLVENSTKQFTRQSDIAKYDRPKKSPSNRSLTIESMREWRKKSHTLEQFIESAINGSVDGLELNESEKDNKRVFELEWDSLPLDKKEEAKLTAYSTLEKWWTAAS